MGKVNLLVKYCLINEKNEYNIKGIFANNEIKFIDNGIKMLINKRENTLKRVTDDAEIVFDFNLKNCSILDRTSNNKISFKIDVLEQSNVSNEFYVKYKIENNVFEVMVKII